MPDKYDEQIDRLMALSEEEFVGLKDAQWGNSVGLFSMCCPYPYQCKYGCPTQIRGNSSIAGTEELTEKIRNDKRIPDNPDDIKQDRKMLGAFAEIQRECDKLFGEDR